MLTCSHTSMKLEEIEVTLGPYGVTVFEFAIILQFEKFSRVNIWGVST